MHKLVIQCTFLMRIKPVQSLGFTRIQFNVGVLATGAYFIIYGKKSNEALVHKIPLTTQASQLTNSGLREQTESTVFVSKLLSS